MFTIRPAIYDIVELLYEYHLPDDRLPIGTRGTIVYQYTDQIYAVEFAHPKGHRTATVPLAEQQFLVIEKRTTGESVSAAQRIAQIVQRLPEEAQHRLLEIARSINAEYLTSILMETDTDAP